MGVWLVLLVCARCVPHIANFSPVIALAVLAGAVFSRRVAVGIMLTGLFFSDCVLSYLYGYPILGSWSVFVYSGLGFCTLLGTAIPRSSGFPRYFLTTVCSGFGFWLWTNLASWWSMYAHSFSGVVQCYVAALPFLQRTLLGSVIALMVIYTVVRILQLREQAAELKLTTAQ